MCKILTFNIYGDISDARLELSMRCVAVDKQDKSITNEVFLGSSSLKVGRYAVISLVESDEHSNFVTEGLNTIRRFSLRAPEDSDVEEVDGRNDYGMCLLFLCGVLFLFLSFKSSRSLCVFFGTHKRHTCFC